MNAEPPENEVETFIRSHDDSSMHMRKKIPVAVLGATGSVGQRFCLLLHKHPWFDLVAVCASDRSKGKRYGEATHWLQTESMPKKLSQLEVRACEPHIDCKIVFSALDSSVAGEVEEEFAKKGYIVVSNARNHRMDQHVPLVVPEVNWDHLSMVHKQIYGTISKKSSENLGKGGMIVTNPNCSVIGLSIALRPLDLEFGVEKVHVVTLQSASGAGFPGVPSMSILDNVIPYIEGEEEKQQQELNKIFGSLDGSLKMRDIQVSATCTRVPVTEGHMAVVSVKLREKASVQDVIRALKEFSSPIQDMQLPSAPTQPIHYFEDEAYPQPKLHRNVEKGMAVSIGRVRPCQLFDYTFVVLSNNMVRGAAGGSILIGELLVKEGLVFW
jgi:aspartate-semialdehyde dehydrogenase